jgi:hypothetical protein
MISLITHQSVYGSGISERRFFKTFGLNSKQVDKWLKLAVDKELIIKEMKPVRFKLKS